VAALDLRLDGRATTGSIGHELSAGVLRTRSRDRFNRLAYNLSGTGFIDGSAITPAAPELTQENPNRDERSTEAYLRDRVALAAEWTLWAGLRHTRLERESVLTDGSEATAYTQTFTTPWLALSRRLSEHTHAYASWGQGVESEVVPNLPRYSNRGEPLPALKSRQLELGIRHGSERMSASLAAFRIVRPVSADTGTCAEDGSCTRRIDGEARHQGLEAGAGWTTGAWQWAGSVMWLDAVRQGASDPASNGLRPVNVPARALKLRATHDVAAWPGLQLQAALVHEGPRMVLPDNSIEAPGWTRIDLGARLKTVLAGRPVQWQLSIDNVADQRAWRETPYEFSHVYLFPLAPRQWRLAVQTSL
jgi:iron complex outermembrane receptor protein